MINIIAYTNKQTRPNGDGLPTCMYIGYDVSAGLQANAWFRRAVWEAHIVSQSLDAVMYASGMGLLPLTNGSFFQQAG